MELGGDAKAVLLLAAAMFLWALLLGVWKYRQMTTSADGLAHPYVDTAHRAALAFYFFAAVGGYALHGWRRDTTNQFHPPAPGLSAFMWTLIVAEIGAWLVLVAGFVDAQIV